MPFRVMVGKLF
ncbi:hypothetical protein F383_34060 [Gossypium arboreum]|uniref:Uncharacterized protein n=1 Tax=Gossypium arboreum TaxID=29729 RepID=A0A0B0MZ38_GOSAR|nr:hypothetical protein F383_34060 [Gossypium arboreum]